MSNTVYNRLTTMTPSTYVLENGTVFNCRVCHTLLAVTEKNFEQCPACMVEKPYCSALLFRHTALNKLKTPRLVFRKPFTEGRSMWHKPGRWVR